MAVERNVVAVSAGVGFPSSTRSLSDRLLAAIVKAGQSHGVAAAATTIEVRELGVAIAEASSVGLPGSELDEALARIEKADLVIASTPTFRGSYTGMFKALWDLVDPVAMRGKPVVLAATGGSARHQLMIDQTMRPLFSYFGSFIVPTAIYATSDELGPRGLPDSLTQRIDHAASQAVEVMANAA